ncbi:MAG: hypothetical protein N3F03_04630 [Ignavibacteria bacterium]|nr:hypothetical protein [Ignavibacteria bacterium]
MGNKVLIIAFATFFILSSVVLMIRGKTTKVSDMTTDYFNTLQAQYIANSALNIYLNKLRFNKNLRGDFKDISLLGGKYDLSITGTDSVLIRVQSRFMNKKAQASVTTIWDNLTIPPVKSGMSISSSNIDIKFSGNILISGIDRNPDGTFGNSPSVAGINVETIADSIRILNEIPNNVRPKITGVGSTPSIGVSQNPSNFMELLNQYIQSADIILQSGTYTTGTILGTPESPKITYIVGNANFAGNASGAGILIVYGDLSCSGNFNYQGLVIVYGNTAISASASGTSSIYGSMIVIGPSVNVTATGSAIINYSSRAIQNITQKLKASKFFVTNWIDW